MSDSKTIDVAMMTWPNHPERFRYFSETCEAMNRFLRASRHELRFFCSAETQHDPNFAWFGSDLEEVCSEYGITLAWRDENPNLGANMNAAIKMCSAELIYVQQDDWRLLDHVDLSPGADYLMAHRDVDLLRYSWPDNDRMRPAFLDTEDGFRHIDLRSTWLYGDDPHLRRRDFMDKWGWYLEGGHHASASSTLMTKLRRGRARIAVADKCYYGHFAQISAYPNETRPGRKR